MNSTNECSICYENIENEKNIIVTECSHKFHSNCLIKNFAHGKYNCPLCRFVLANVEESDNDSDEYEDDEDEYEDDEDEYEDEYDEYYNNEDNANPTSLYNDYALRGLRFFTNQIQGSCPTIKDIIDEQTRYNFDYEDGLECENCNNCKEKYSNYSLRGLRLFTNMINNDETSEQDKIIEKLEDNPEPHKVTKLLIDNNISYSDLVNCILYKNFTGYFKINKADTFKSQKKVIRNINMLISEHKNL
jgi:hypothetical protein